MKLLREWWPIIVAVITAVGLYFAIDRTLLFGFWPSFALSGIEAETRANLGALGDVMGGLLNPVLTFITIILLIQTIRISQKTLRQTEESLKISDETLKATKEQIELNRQELADTRVEIAKASAAQEQMAENQVLQRKESSFYQAYKMYADAVESAEKPAEGKGRSSSPLARIISYISHTGIDLEQRIKALNDSRLRDGELTSCMKFSALCLELSEGNTELDYLISAMMSLEMQAYMIAFCHYVDSNESRIIKSAIKSYRLNFSELLNSEYCKRDIYYKALEDIMS